MKKICINAFIIIISLVKLITSEGEIKTLIPDEKLILKGVKLNKEILLNLNINNFLQSQKYKY